MKREEFLHDRKTQLALGMCFIKLGNAFSGLRAGSPELAARFPELEDAVGFRNVLAHNYETVDPAISWKIARETLPEIGRAVASLISESDPGEGHTAKHGSRHWGDSKRRFGL